jgi:hypothetical protein
MTPEEEEDDEMFDTRELNEDQDFISSKITESNLLSGSNTKH